MATTDHAAIAAATANHASAENTTSGAAAITPATPESPLTKLRMAAGYRSDREFAAKLGVPATTYARYEKAPGYGIPMRAAIQIADELGCSLDEVVGRTAPSTLEHVQISFEIAKLSAESRRSIYEYLDYLKLRDRLAASAEH